MARVRAVSRLCELYPGIYLTAEVKANKNPSQDSRRVPDGTMKTEYTEQNIHNNGGKGIPLQAWTSPENSRRLRLPDVQTIGT